MEWIKMGVLADEMEANALYLTSARLGKNVVCLCTISDEILTGNELSSDDRETDFSEMITTALEIAIMD